MINANKVPATKLQGGIEIIRERDIRRRGKPFNDMVECEPATCACCGRKIYKVAELRNGDIIGSECACIIPNCPAMRMGRFLNKRQQEYAIKHGLLPVVHKYAGWPAKALCGVEGEMTSIANSDVTCAGCQ